MKNPQVFISYAGRDQFEASLLQYAIESLLQDIGVRAWTYQRDQERSEQEIAARLKDSVRSSGAMIFLLSPHTMDGGAAQWMEFAYADAFEIRTFILLHRLEYADLRTAESGVPPLLLASQCNLARDWRGVVADLRVQLDPGVRSER